MSDDPVSRRRRSIRLRGYDYARAGAYFVTICTQGRLCLFGEIVDETMRLNAVGRMVHSAWSEFPDHYPGVEIDSFVVMPNHIHGIVVLSDASTTTTVAAAGQWQGPMSLADVVHRFKTLTTKRYVDGVKRERWPPFSGRVWQRNYYEHVIRDEESLDRIREYVAGNPARWAVDRENPAATKPESPNAWLR